MNLRLPVRSVAAILSLTLLALSLGCLYPEPYWYGPRRGYGGWHEWNYRGYHR